jgi:hypothetical protein
VVLGFKLEFIPVDVGLVVVGFAVIGIFVVGFAVFGIFIVGVAVIGIFLDLPVVFCGLRVVNDVGTLVVRVGAAVGERVSL